MLFRMRSNMLFRLFPLLTAQAGFAPVDICLISENCYNKAVRTLMKLNGSTAVDFSALDAEFSALQSGSAELRTQLETLQPDISALKNIRKYIDMVLNKQQLSAPGGKMPEKESVLKKLNDSKAALEQKKLQPQQNVTEHTL